MDRWSRPTARPEAAVASAPNASKYNAGYASLKTVRPLSGAWRDISSIVHGHPMHLSPRTLPQESSRQLLDGRCGETLCTSTCVERVSPTTLTVLFFSDGSEFHRLRLKKKFLFQSMINFIFSYLCVFRNHNRTSHRFQKIRLKSSRINAWLKDVFCRRLKYRTLMLHRCVYGSIKFERENQN